VPPAAENSCAHCIKVKCKIWKQDHWYLKLVRLFGLGFLPWDDNEPAVPFQNKLAADFDRSKVFRPERHVGDKAKHQTVAEGDRLADVKFRVQLLLGFIHQLQGELQQLHARDL
jgi:hypothetical protein